MYRLRAGAQLLWRAAAPVLLLLAVSAAPAATSGGGSVSAPHTVFVAECSDYMDWQSITVVYSHRKAGVAGPITRLLTCSNESLASYPNVDLVPTHVAPSWTVNPHNHDSYLAYNKPGAIMHWLQTAPPQEEWVLVIDPDMIIRDSFATWGTSYGAGRGWAVSVHFGYMQGVSNNLSDTHMPQIEPRQDALAGPRGRRGDQVSGVVLMHRDDLAATAPLWLHYSEVVRDDPMAWNETGDEWAQQPGRKPWIAEMYGYSFGAATAGVWHRVDLMAQLYPGYTAYDKPLILHYGRLFGIGPRFSFQKHWFFHFKPLQCPPWKHMSRPLKGQAASAGITGGLYPHPPEPREFRDLPPLERYKELLSASVITTINAALCQRHLVACQPSIELQRECSKAKRLEREVDAALLLLERGGPLKTAPLCMDLKPADECHEWVRQDYCWGDPLFMHYYCRESCGMCRLPAGRPQLPFGSPLPGPPAGINAAGSQDEEAGQNEFFQHALGKAARLEWHELHAQKLPGYGSSEVAGSFHADLTRGIMYGALAAWAIMVGVVFGVLLRNVWRRRRGHAADQHAPGVLDRLLAGSTGGSRSGSGHSSPSYPLLRGQSRAVLKPPRRSLDDLPASGAASPTSV